MVLHICCTAAVACTERQCKSASSVAELRLTDAPSHHTCLPGTGTPPHHACPVLPACTLHAACPMSSSPAPSSTWIVAALHSYMQQIAALHRTRCRHCAVPPCTMLAPTVACSLHRRCTCHTPHPSCYSAAAPAANPLNAACWHAPTSHHTGATSHGCRLLPDPEGPLV